MQSYRAGSTGWRENGMSNREPFADEKAYLEWTGGKNGSPNQAKAFAAGFQARADLAAQREAELVAEVERLREAIRRAPCRQDSIPCSWPCGHDPSEHGPCWKQEALQGEVEG